LKARKLGSWKAWKLGGEKAGKPGKLMVAKQDARKPKKAGSEILIDWEICLHC